MEKRNIDELIDNALAEYDQVMSEYNKPQEDVVMFSTCHIIERAIVNLLDAFLVAHDEVPLYGKDLQGIQKRCVEFDPVFEKLDFTFIYDLQVHSDDAQGYVLHDYVKALKETKDLVIVQLDSMGVWSE
ncbi:MAG: hypothetical protein NXI20_17005 [bacterium]|nr:hypothetical protein [bacterium]